ncbi:hypothetical protein EAJ19_23830 [Escherichia coli]|nr:hypothetical protein EAJ19_23830 [Escherichia coli]
MGARTIGPHKNNYATKKRETISVGELLDTVGGQRVKSNDLPYHFLHFCILLSVSFIEITHHKFGAYILKLHALMYFFKLKGNCYLNDRIKQSSALMKAKTLDCFINIIVI